MSGVKRFSWNGLYGMEELADGDYVLHSDHEAEVARLRAELQNAAKAALDAVALSCEKEREADALRTEVEGLRTTLEVIAVGDSRTPHIDAAQALLRSGYWTDEIDAAMGASA